MLWNLLWNISNSTIMTTLLNKSIKKEKQWRQKLKDYQDSLELI